MHWSYYSGVITMKAGKRVWSKDAKVGQTFSNALHSSWKTESLESSILVSVSLRAIRVYAKVIQ